MKQHHYTITTGLGHKHGNQNITY